MNGLSGKGQWLQKASPSPKAKKDGHTEPQAEASHNDASLPQQQSPSDSDHESGTEDFESSNFSLDLNLSDFTPVPEVSCFDNVGQHVPLK